VPKTIKTTEEKPDRDQKLRETFGTVVLYKVGRETEKELCRGIVRFEKSGKSGEKGDFTERKRAVESETVS